MNLIKDLFGDGYTFGDCGELTHNWEYFGTCKDFRICHRCGETEYHNYAFGFSSWDHVDFDLWVSQLDNDVNEESKRLEALKNSRRKALQSLKKENEV